MPTGLQQGIEVRADETAEEGEERVLNDGAELSMKSAERHCLDVDHSGTRSSKIETGSEKEASDNKGKEAPRHE